MNNRFKLLMQAQQSEYEVDSKDVLAEIVLPNKQKIGFSKDFIILFKPERVDRYGWRQSEDLFRQDLDLFYQNCFANPFKPTKLELDVFKLMYNIDWPICAQGETCD